MKHETQPRHPTRHRLRLVTAAVLGCVVLSGCDAPRPDVTFYGNRTAVETGPTRWCTVDAAAEEVNCEDAAEEDIERLTVGPGKAVQINVPGDIGNVPWAVYFRYLDKDGKLADGRSEIFTDGRLAYTLEPFDAADQLTYVEVQSGFILMGGEQSGVDFAVTRSWLLLVDPPAADAEDAADADASTG
ncbi:MAG: DUF2771 family protein [Nakamurella sp.]